MTPNPSQDETFHVVQPHRDLQQNWTVDLAKNLEEYLLKICSGEINDDEENEHLSINFAEAALLLQGSIQVYSRKVEYLYNLVLHALDFISQKRQHDQPDGSSVQPEESVSHAGPDDENDMFWGLDDIPVEAKNSLDSASGKDAPVNQFVKPPANLVVLEGECLDTSSDAGELESYLLATSNLYRDFILLDPCDAIAVDDFLKEDVTGKAKNGGYRGSSLKSKSRKSFQSPLWRSNGSAHKSTCRKGQDVNLNQTPGVHCNSAAKETNMEHDTTFQDFPGTSNYGFDMDDGYSDHGAVKESDDDDDEDDPWKPLNPHEPGNLKVKPFRKVKATRRHAVGSSKLNHITTQFPLAKLHGTISPELHKIWEKHHEASKRQRESQDPPLYEKLRHSLIHGGNESFDVFSNPEVYNEDNGNDSDNHYFEQPYMDVPYMDEDIENEKHDDDDVHFDTNATYEHEDQHTHANLEDLCRSHLDALLASIAETEKQTELAARVSTWKQRIEQNLEEQESRTPFDIHDYGGRILEKLSLKAGNENPLSFAEVVKGQEKHDVARSFSALLQLVNNGDVDLDRGGVNGEPVCYTAKSPFHVRLLNHKKNPKEVHLPSSRKRIKSPLSRNRNGEIDRGKSERETPNKKFPIKLTKGNGVRCTPEGKRRRRSQLVEPVDLHTAG